MLRPSIFLLLFFTSHSSAMDMTVAAPLSTKKRSAKFYLPFLPLPREIAQQISEYCIKNTLTNQSEESQICALEDALNFINSIALVNKKLYTIINKTTDYLIKIISTDFNVSNEYVARMIKTEAAFTRYNLQNKLLNLCLSPPEKKILIQQLDQLAKDYPSIDWNFTYPHKCHLRSKRDHCNKNHDLQCSHKPKHQKKSRQICSHIAIQKDSYTILMLMCIRSTAIEPIKFLITKGASINSVSSDGKNVPMIRLMYSMRMVEELFLDLFLEQPTLKINHKDFKGNTYLLWFLSYLTDDFYARKIKGILDKGADPEIVNKKGQSALSFVNPTKQPTIWKLINDSIIKKRTGSTPDL